MQRMILYARPPPSEKTFFILRQDVKADSVICLRLGSAKVFLGAIQVVI